MRLHRIWNKQSIRQGRFATRFTQWLPRLYQGVMLIAVGVLVFFDLLTELSVYLTWFNQFAW